MTQDTYMPQQRQREQDDAIMEQLAAGFGISLEQFLHLTKAEFDAHWARYSARHEVEQAQRQRSIAIIDAMRALFDRFPRVLHGRGGLDRRR